MTHHSTKKKDISKAKKASSEAKRKDKSRKNEMGPRISGSNESFTKVNQNLDNQKTKYASILVRRRGIWCKKRTRSGARNVGKGKRGYRNLNQMAWGRGMGSQGRELNENKKRAAKRTNRHERTSGWKRTEELGGGNSIAGGKAPGSQGGQHKKKHPRGLGGKKKAGGQDG